MIGWFTALPGGAGRLFNQHKSCPKATPATISTIPPPTSLSQSHRGSGGNILTSRILFSADEDPPEGSEEGPKGKGYHMAAQREKHPPVLQTVFTMVHHPASPMTSEVLFYPASHQYTDYAANCREVLLTRTGSLANMPNKCLALVPVVSSHADTIPHMIRRGYISHLTDMYSADYTDAHGLKEEASLLPPLLTHLEALSAALRQLVGPTDTIIVMVLNTGVLDLFVNFLCSCRAAGIFQTIQEKLVVFTAQPELDDILAAYGIKVFSSVHLARISANAAGAYGDGVFGMAMWLKDSAVFVAAYAGYHVLFQVGLCPLWWVAVVFVDACRCTVCCCCSTCCWIKLDPTALTGFPGCRYGLAGRSVATAIC